MDRRRFCAGLLWGLGSLSGCAALDRGGDGSGTAEPPAATTDAETAASATGAGVPTPAGDTGSAATSPETTKLAGMGIPAKICESEVVEDFSISEIVDPAFNTDWTGYDLSPKYTRLGGRGEGEAGLPEEAVVVGLESGERARARIRCPSSGTTGSSTTRSAGR